MPAFDRILQTTTATGTGSIPVASLAPVVGYQTFASRFAEDADTIHYAIVAVDENGVPTGEWEIGAGLLSGGELLRDSVSASSNADALVDFGAGTKQVFGALSVQAVSVLASEVASVQIVNSLDNHVADVDPHGDRAYAAGLASVTDYSNLQADNWGLPALGLSGDASTAQPFLSGTTELLPFTSSVDGVIAEASIEVTTSVAASTARLLIYRADYSSGFFALGALVADLGEVDCSTIGLKSITGLSTQIAKGESYVLGVAPSVNGLSMRKYTWRVSGPSRMGRGASGTVSNHNGVERYYAVGTAASPPAPGPIAGATVAGSSTPYVRHPMRLRWT